MTTTSNNMPEPTPEATALQKKCDDEFAWYEKERPSLVKSEIDSEKNYDTLLVTLSTLAIGSSFTVLKDVTRTSSASALILLAWLTFGLCLFIALADRLLSYWTHRRWRQILDAKFAPWQEGARERALAEYPNIRLIWLLPWLKWIGLLWLLLGMIFLMVFVFIATGVAPDVPKSATPVIVNVYNSPPSTTITSSSTRAGP
jgi:hypothetical protein